MTAEKKVVKMVPKLLMMKQPVREQGFSVISLM
jgi:hypothetical protein